MSDPRLNRIQSDLQRARTVIYLEGSTDTPLFFALAGLIRPSSGILQDVYVVGLKDKNAGSGGREVRALVETAVQHGLGGAPGIGGVFGIIDGDGENTPNPGMAFDPPYSGPLFVWPVYCIENLLAAHWPVSWGLAPDWEKVLESYLPYSALNRVHVELRRALQTLRLDRFQQPVPGQPLRNETDIRAALAIDKGEILGRDVEAMFDAELARQRQRLNSSIEEGHACVNGKWLVTHFARDLRPHASEDALRCEWADANRLMGGVPQVRTFWNRIAGGST